MYDIRQVKKRVCNRLAGSSRCRKIRKRGDCSGTDDYCPSRDGLRTKPDAGGGAALQCSGEILGRMEL